VAEILSGIKEGESLIVHGTHRVSDGGAVKLLGANNKEKQ